MNDHKKYIKRCIQLAKNGLGLTYPNPLVGSVIVHNNKIIGEGWHRKAGEEHAEVHAVQSVKETSLLKEATIYVSLEPCSHFGKTPPCADLIIKSGIPKVVIGCVDTFSEVAGKGIDRLRNHGCDVILGILEDECIELNKRFFTFHNEKRPYTILKWAETSDGFIAPENNSKITWISNAYSKQLSHKLRATETAILIGTNTAIIDNSQLNTRDWKGNQPLRVIVDRTGKIPEHHHIFDGSQPTLILSEVPQEYTKNNIAIESIDFNDFINEINRVLFDRGIQSLIIEGGAKTLQSFIDKNAWDEAFVFKGSSELKSGVKAPSFSKKEFSTQLIANDTLNRYKR
ncbi:MAG: bifunctional diaminohydroxyphosphoribosylaminopyrimidine deaminase/5-amino-6-(5-phosphoribosylamino)uracil reductase RibD [Flavobacteriaceae bacterium]|nr:bifunctional diaminohydroxyphosphoribosylaminopyrimidine deaminase/5-amino-6-(5-phosphoribosylamino)uracil reductase RibD [Flavobacteriaceae bacterium]